MPKPYNLLGQKFGHLLVKEDAGSKDNRYSCLCLCDCGNTKLIRSSALTRGHTRSCGCLQREVVRQRNTSHGESRSSEYSIWAGMKARCYNPKATYYENYGGRGISVCEHWLHSFENFLSDMGKRPSPKHTIDRIDNDKNYEPTNCQWITRAEQNRNQRSNIKITYQGETKNLSEWSKITGISFSGLKQRLFVLHWPIEKSLTTPVTRKDLITFNEQTKSYSEWSKILGIPANALWLRIYQYGWSVERAFATPVKIKGSTRSQ